MWQLKDLRLLVLAHNVALILLRCMSGVGSQDIEPIQPRSFSPRVTLGDNIYYLGLFQKTTWHQAVHICAFQGMSLLRIDSKSTHEALRKFLSDHGILDVQFWLSGNNLVLPHEFYWLDNGQPLRYTAWAEYEPNQESEKGCVYTLPSFEWALGDCWSLYYFMCQAPVLPYCDANGNCKRQTRIF